MTAYYNEINRFAAAWLRELIKDELIAPGDVDERSIADVQPEDLRGYTQCHFFAGIGGWSYALRRAGWEDDRPVWTGSCPCQPFSAAGKQKGKADERHLWPEFYRLITKCVPAVCFGEQVASKLGRAWAADVQTDMEALGYAFARADLCSASIGAAHIRQRLYWVADAMQSGRAEWGPFAGSRPSTGRGSYTGGLAHAEYAERRAECKELCEAHGRYGPRGCRDTSGLADANRGKRNGLTGGKGRLSDGAQAGWDKSDCQPECRGKPCRVGDAISEGLEGQSGDVNAVNEPRWVSEEQDRPFAASGLSMWWRCTDGKSRLIPATEKGEPEPLLFPLAHGVPNRVGILRGAGNAIDPRVAEAFIRSFRQVRDDYRTGDPMTAVSAEELADRAELSEKIAPDRMFRTRRGDLAIVEREVVLDSGYRFFKGVVIDTGGKTRVAWTPFGLCSPILSICPLDLMEAL